MLRFPQRMPGLYEENPEGRAIIFNAGIIRSSGAIQQCGDGAAASFPEEKKNYLFENS
jgi:hypothetical protein